LPLCCHFWKNFRFKLDLKLSDFWADIGRGKGFNFRFIQDYLGFGLLKIVEDLGGFEMSFEQ